MSDNSDQDRPADTSSQKQPPTPRRRVLNVTIAMLALAVTVTAIAYLVTASAVAPALERSSPAGDAGAASAGWSTDVFWTDVAPGACLDQSFEWNTDEVDADFNANATGFRIVDCDRNHLARVLVTVDKPLAYTWQRFGASDGATTDEANAWIAGVCAASQDLLAYARRGADDGDRSTVRVAKSQLGVDILGECLLVARAGVTDTPGEETIDDLRIAAAEIRSFDP